MDTLCWFLVERVRFQESPPDASGPGLEHAGAQVPPLLVPHDATNVDQLTLLQSAQAAHAAQVAQAAQIQQQAFRLQVQQLAALHGVLNAARHKRISYYVC